MSHLSLAPQPATQPQTPRSPSIISCLEAAQPFGLNAQGDHVKALQQALTNLGFLTAGITGNFDIGTREALLKFKTHYKLISDPSKPGAGDFGPRTKATLLAILSSSTGPSLVTHQTPRSPSIISCLEAAQPFGLNAQGDHVKALQQALTDLGFFTASISSHFDTKTREALLRFKTHYKLISDPSKPGAGDFGPRTKTTLLAILSLPAACPPELRLVRPESTVVPSSSKATRHAVADTLTDKPRTILRSSAPVSSLEEAQVVMDLWKSMFFELNTLLSEQPYPQTGPGELPSFFTLDRDHLATLSQKGFHRAEETKGSLSHQIWSTLCQIFDGTYVSPDNNLLAHLAARMNAVIARTVGQGYRLEPAGNSEHIVDLPIAAAPFPTILALDAGADNLFNSGFRLVSPPDSALTKAHDIPPSVRFVDSSGSLRVHIASNI